MVALLDHPRVRPCCVVDIICWGTKSRYKFQEQHQLLLGLVAQTWLGSHCTKDAWFQLTAIRTIVVISIEGGIGTVFQRLLDAFWDDSGHNMETAGVMLTQPDGSQLLKRMKLGIVIHVGCRQWRGVGEQQPSV